MYGLYNIRLVNVIYSMAYNLLELVGFMEYDAVPDSINISKERTIFGR